MELCSLLKDFIDVSKPYNYYVNQKFSFNFKTIFQLKNLLTHKKYYTSQVVSVSEDLENHTLVKQLDFKLNLLIDLHKKLCTYVSNIVSIAQNKKICIHSGFGEYEFYVQANRNLYFEKTFLEHFVTFNLCESSVIQEIYNVMDNIITFNSGTTIFDFLADYDGLIKNVTDQDALVILNLLKTYGFNYVPLACVLVKRANEVAERICEHEKHILEHIKLLNTLNFSAKIIKLCNPRVKNYEECKNSGQFIDLLHDCYDLFFSIMQLCDDFSYNPMTIDGWDTIKNKPTIVACKTIYGEKIFNIKFEKAMMFADEFFNTDLRIHMFDLLLRHEIVWYLANFDDAVRLNSEPLMIYLLDVQKIKVDDNFLSFVAKRNMCKIMNHILKSQHVSIGTIRELTYLVNVDTEMHQILRSMWGNDTVWTLRKSDLIALIFRIFNAYNITSRKPPTIHEVKKYIKDPYGMLNGVNIMLIIKKCSSGYMVDTYNYIREKKRLDVKTANNELYANGFLRDKR